MAKITITIEDKPGGGVQVVADPTFQTMAQMIVSGSSDHTAAHGYALRAIKAIREASEQAQKEKSPLKIWLPKTKSIL